MRHWIRSHLTYANIVATLSLFLILGGGTALASFVVSSNSQIGPGTVSGHNPPGGKHANIISSSVNATDLVSGAVGPAKLRDNAVSSPKVARDSLTGADINESTLGTVPNASHANNADNAANLGGKPASDYRDHCPSGYTLAAHSNLCFEFDRRSPATFTDALKICAGNGGHLPSPGELAVAFDNLSPFQGSQWTTSTWFTNSGAAAVTMRQSSTRDITLGADLTTTPNDYRCVTSPSN